MRGNLKKVSIVLLFLLLFQSFSLPGIGHALMKNVYAEESGTELADDKSYVLVSTDGETNGGEEENVNGSEGNSVAGSVYNGEESNLNENVYESQVTGIDLDYDSLTLNVGETGILHATISPEDAADKNVIWSSNNPDVASVDGNGNVAGINEGTAIITAVSEADSSYQASCAVSVVAESIDLFFSVTDEAITITWNAVTGAIGYDIEADGTVIDNGLNTEYVNSGLQPNTRHTYRIRARRAAGTGNWSALSVKYTMTSPGSGNGLKGDYFNAENLTDYKITRVDETVNFDWKNKEPMPEINKDQFSVRWTGQVEARLTEEYTFYTESHGGIRLWVDGQLLLDDWDAHNQTHQSGSISLRAGKRYDIRLEYNESNGVSRAELYWSSESQPKEIIPKSQLYPVGIPQDVTAAPREYSITLNWDAYSQATAYEVEVDGIVADAGAGTSFTHNGLVPGTLHTYRVRAISGTLTGDWSQTVTARTILGIPSNVSLEATETSISVSWDPVIGAVGYDVEIEGIVIDNGANTNFEHSDLEPGSLHTYRIRARSEAADGSWTSLQKKWTLPGIPQNIQLTSTGSSITIGWDPVTGATGYDVEVQGTPVNAGPDTKYTNTGLTPNLQQTYRVRAKNSSGAGKWSEIVAKTTLPAAPSNLNAEATDTEVRVTWDAVAGAKSYDIEVDGAEIYNISGTSYLHIGLASNSQHTYRVQARNDDGIGDWSDILTVTTLTSVPRNFNVRVTSAGIIATWDPVEGADGYDIEVDGEVIDNGTSTTYTHAGYQPNTEHTYRVRSRYGNTVSHWSEEILRKTLTGVPTNLNTAAASTKIAVTWEPVVGAISYELEVDGKIINVGLNTRYIHTGLNPNTEHTYRVRAVNEGGAGQWSETVTERTIFGTPENLRAETTETSVRLTWDPVDGADGYDVMVDGQIIDNGTSTAYIHSGLEPSTTHIYRVRARIGDYAGEWSEAVIYTTGLGIPANVTAIGGSTSITVTWDTVAGATGYDVEVDGMVIDVGDETVYIHKGLSPGTTHTYRVRAKNERVTGAWSALISKSTVTGMPGNLRTEAETTRITVLWDGVSGVAGYDLEADGEIVSVSDTNYLHEELQPNTRHKYRVRARFDDGPGEWTEAIEANTVPEIQVNVAKDNMFNFVVVVPKKDDVSQRTITITYDPEELEVIDLYGATQKYDVTAGVIEGTDITVTEFEQGTIMLEVGNADKTVVNVVKFMSKTNEPSRVEYIVE